MCDLGLKRRTAAAEQRGRKLGALRRRLTISGKNVTRMTTRTTNRTVTFKRPFILNGFSEVQASGTYTVETEEEQLDAISFPAWKRTCTIIHLHNGTVTEYPQIDPDELREALLRDEAQDDPALEPGPDSEAGRLSRARLPRLARRKKF